MVIRSLLQTAALSHLDAEVLLAHVLGIDRAQLLFRYGEAATPEVVAAFSSLAEKCRAGCPVAYLVGEREFYGLPFFVTPDTLIPRPDTELLVDWALPYAKGARLLDLCCGTGCIGLSIAAQEKPLSLTLADISPAALAVALENAARLHVEADFLQLDILKEPLAGEYDCIVSNPPYIEDAVIESLSPSVRDFEPRLALSGGADGLRFYPVLIEKAYHALAFGGRLCIEIGYKQGDTVKELMAPFFTEVTVQKDLAGNPRMVTGRKKP